MARCGSCGGGRKPLGSTPRPTSSTKPGTGSKPTEAKIQPRPSTHTTGRTQTFALQTPDGQVRHYGSRLERDADKVRRGGRIIS